MRVCIGSSERRTTPRTVLPRVRPILLRASQSSPLCCYQELLKQSSTRNQRGLGSHSETSYDTVKYNCRAHSIHIQNENMIHSNLIARLTEATAKKDMQNPRYRTCRMTFTSSIQYCTPCAHEMASTHTVPTEGHHFGGLLLSGLLRRGKCEELFEALPVVLGAVSYGTQTRPSILHSRIGVALKHGR